MVAVDCRGIDFERRQVARQRFEHDVQHLLPVAGRVVLRPGERVPVIGEQSRALGEEGEIAIRQPNIGPGDFVPGLADEVLADTVADAAAAGMQHDPDALRFVEADLDEMVAAAEGAELARPRISGKFFRRDAGMALEDFDQPRFDRACRLLAHAAVAVHFEADRHDALDPIAQPA